MNRLARIVISFSALSFLAVLSTSAQTYSTYTGTSLNIIRDFGAVCNGVNDDTAAFTHALSSTYNGRSIFVPAGTCVLNNASSAITSSFSGKLYGEGFGSKIVCANNAAPCLSFNSANGLVITDLNIAYKTPASSRNNPAQLLLILGATGVSVDRVWLHDGASSALGIAASSKITISDVHIYNMKANGIILANVVDVKTSNLSCNTDGDACFEASYYDSNASTYNATACKNITLTGMISQSDLVGININGCDHVSISDFVIDSTTSIAVVLQQDLATTSTKWPDYITLTNGTITHSGSHGVALFIAKAPANPLHIRVDDLHVSNTADNGLIVQDYPDTVSTPATMGNNFIVDLSNTRFESIGSAGSGADAMNIQGGKEIHVNNVTAVSVTGRLLSYFNSPGSLLTGTHLVADNTNLSKLSGYTVANLSSGLVNIDGLTLIDAATPATYSALYDLSTSGQHYFTNILPLLSSTPISGHTAYRTNGATIFSCAGGVSCVY